MDHFVFGSGGKNFIILPGLSLHSVMGLSGVIADAYKSFAGPYTVYVFDVEKSIPEGYTIRKMADDTAATMKALGIEKADIFGVSMGGMIAMELAIHHPELVDRMIIGSTLARQNDTLHALVTKWETLAAEKDEAALLEGIVDCVYSKATLEAYREILISSIQGVSDEEYERFLILTKSCRSFDCYEELPRIQCPVLVLGSEGDQLMTAESTKQIAEKLNCELYLYDNRFGHGVYDEAPDYKQRCLNFLMR